MPKEPWVIDFEILERIIRNKRQCLCKVNTPCICDEFLQTRICLCGLFTKKL